MEQTAQTALTTNEAVLLAHGLVQRLADTVDARVLFVKGPTAVAVGARPPRPSSDVDVLVDPASFEALCAAIEGLGWIRRVVPTHVPRAADVVFDHSAHFIHAQWPCDLDLHYLFPGFLADPSIVFQALWASRTEVAVAGVSVDAPNLAGQALIVGLHALRDLDRPGSAQDLAHLADVLPSALDESGRAALAEVAVETGARESAREVLTYAGVRTEPLAEASPELRAWRVRQEFGTTSGSFWLVELTRAPWRERPRVVADAVLPPRELLLSSHLAMTATRPQIAWLHLRRWGRGLRALPRAIKILGELRGSADR
jgi:hypothetical protein